MSRFANGFLLMLVILTGLPGLAAAGIVTGARVLTYPPNARAMALAEAYTALADDWSAVYANPGALGCLAQPQLGATYFKGLLDTYYTSAAVAVPMGSGLTLGAGFAYLDGGNLDIVAADGTERSVKAQQDMVLTLSGGFQVYQSNGVGLNVKLVQSRLAQDYSAYTVAFDAGLRYSVWRELVVGLAVKNLGPRLKYVDEGDLLPASFQAGAAYNWKFARDHELRAAGDLYKPLDQDFKLHLGTEYMLANWLSGRMGYQFGYALSGFTLGVGFDLAGISLDYALMPRGDLEVDHLVTLGVRW